MRYRTPFLLLLLIICGCTSTVKQPAAAPPIQWQDWSDEVFARAKQEHKFVLLDLQAVWCHWCHVMDDTTYRDPKVSQLIASKFIAVKVDQDSRPDLSNRYEDYGWPATVVFDPNGGEIVKRRGYIPPPAMASMLQAIINDPKPGPSVLNDTPPPSSSADSLAISRRTELLTRLTSLYDTKSAGWAGDHKFIDPDTIEYCLIDGDANQKQMAIDTLAAMRKLIDPVWGGVYQYSINGDWDHPHFEKIMFYQANDLRIYAQAYLATGSADDLKTAQDIHRFLDTFLRDPQGAFYVSQDADVVDTQQTESDAYFKLDDAQRRQRGVPRVDTHIYSRENGWAIAGLVQLYDVTGDANVLSEATTATNWIIAHRAIDGGGFRHDSTDAAGPFLGDSLAMGQAFLSLYGSTADRAWLERAEAAADFIAAHFVNANPGIATSAGNLTSPTAARPQLDENVAAARFANLLFRYDGIDQHHQLALRAMRYLAAPQSTATRGWVIGGVLLADREINSEPLHVTVVGAKSDSSAKELFRTALTSPRFYKRTDWFDPAEGKLPNTDVEYPQLSTAAAFLCTGSICSRPMTDSAKLAARLKNER
jgi:hypothetical protein